MPPRDSGFGLQSKVFDLVVGSGSLGFSVRLQHQVERLGRLDAGGSRLAQKLGLATMPRLGNDAPRLIAPLVPPRFQVPRSL